RTAASGDIRARTRKMTLARCPPGSRAHPSWQMVERIAERRTMMKLSLSRMALATGCLVFPTIILAQDHPATQCAAPQPAPTNPRTGRENSTAPSEPGVTILTTFPGDSGPGPKDNDGTLVQEGFVDDPDRDYLVPSLAVDAQGNIGLGCTGTSASEYPSVYVMMHAAS